MLITSPSRSKYERGRIHRALVHINLVTKKMESGAYPMEQVDCFCGSASGDEITAHERYNIPHRLVICEECALIRATPRMTQEGYTSFYNNNYRFINIASHKTRALYSAKQDERLLWEIQTGKSEKLLANYRTIGADDPKSVMDWGCHLGGMLRSFKDIGAECYGLEIDEGAVSRAQASGVTIFRTIDEMIENEVKVDFVIMQDMVEHLLDLHELKKVKQVLNPRGMLYIWTPGLFRHSAERLFQIAHTYQFCANTLDYVMNKCGFQNRFLDENISSFWVTDDEGVTYDLPKPSDWVRYSVDHIANKEIRALPPLRATCKFTRKERHENIRENCKHQIPDVHEIRNTYEGELMIVAGGPSVDNQLDKIKELSARHVPLMVIARMYPWCWKNELFPDFVVSMDSMEEQEKGFTDLCPGAIHLMASVSRPSIINMLEGHLMYFWDSMDDPRVRDIRKDAGYTVVTVVNGGGTVTTCSMSLAMILGFRKLHIFGFDCLIKPGGPTHSKNIAGESVPMDPFEITVGDEKVMTTFPFTEFAKQALDMIWAGHNEGLLEDIQFYGESLITKMWDGKFYADKEEAEKEHMNG